MSKGLIPKLADASSMDLKQRLGRPGLLTHVAVTSGPPFGMQKLTLYWFDSMDMMLDSIFECVYI